MRRRDLLIGLALAPTLLGAKRRAAHRLVIHKAKRKMELFIGRERVRTFDVGLGGAPEGDKDRQGDLRTPEGEFYVAWKNPRSSFHRFLGLSYPMPRHAARGRRRGLIDTRVAKRIASRVRRRGIPPQKTPLGGYVGIHGGGAGSDWTLGCIAVSDAEIEWLFARIRRGDVVEVKP